MPVQFEHVQPEVEQEDFEITNITPKEEAAEMTEEDEENQLGLNNSIRNVLFYNRGKQRYTTSYTFLTNTSRNLLSIGFQENKVINHQLNLRF